MPNPIYILQLTDWHINENNFEEANKAAGVLNENIAEFLKERGRDGIDLMLITGDMMDKNGSTSGKSHGLAHEVVNKISREVFGKEDVRNIFCTPGNHDVDFEKNSTIINKYKNYLKNDAIPNYIVVDNEYENLKNNFSRYSEFCNNIVAKNKENPFVGFASVKVGSFEIFISWLNTSWLSIERYNDIFDLSGKKRFPDDGNISVGYKINVDVLKAFKNTKADFTINISHHFPRLLNWFDIYKLKDNKKYDEAKLEKIVPDYKNDFRSVVFNNDDCSLYEHLKQYNLVLNGHTHGYLEDPPFHTSSDIIENEFSLAENFVNIYEIDLYRNYFVKHFIKVNDNSPAKNRKIFVFNEDKFEENLKSRYDKKDLKNDLLSNNYFSAIKTNSNLSRFNNVKLILDYFSISQEKFIKNPFFYEKKYLELKAKSMKNNKG